jgi:hypothetical protein
LTNHTVAITLEVGIESAYMVRFGVLPVDTRYRSNKRAQNTITSKELPENRNAQQLANEFERMRTGKCEASGAAASLRVYKLMSFSERF